MERYRGKKVLVVGIGRTGFALIDFFNRLECEIRVTDIKPIFDLNKAVKRLKKLTPNPEHTFGEHKDEDFLAADVVVYSAEVDPSLSQLELARTHGKEVYSEMELAARLCRKPIILICGSESRTTTAHMIGYTMKMDGKNAFVCGTSDAPFISYFFQPNMESIDYIILEASALQIQTATRELRPRVVVLTSITDDYPKRRFRSIGEYIETKLSIVKSLSPDDYLIVNFDTLSNNAFLKNAPCKIYWYTRRSFVQLGVIGDVQGTHFHDRRIHSNVHHHSEYKVNKMRIVGEQNRSSLLATITTCKALELSDESVQTCIEKFPGIPHHLEFVVEKNGVVFYNDSVSEDMEQLTNALQAFKARVILIAGGKDTEQNYEPYMDAIRNKARLLVLVGECKERMNRALGDGAPTFLVGSFEESILLAYQKSRTGDVVLLAPGNQSSDSFRDFEERGNYFKKLVYQL